jgi:hypothetical protein
MRPQHSTGNKLVVVVSRASGAFADTIPLGIHLLAHLRPKQKKEADPLSY